MNEEHTLEELSLQRDFNLEAERDAATVEDLYARHPEKPPELAPGSAPLMSDEEATAAVEAQLKEIDDQQIADTEAAAAADAAGQGMSLTEQVARAHGTAAIETGKYLFHGLPTDVFHGIRNLAPNLRDATSAVEEELKSVGISLGPFLGPKGYQPDFQDSFAAILLSAVNTNDTPEERNRPVRALTTWLGGYLLTKRLTAAAGVTAGLAKLGKTGAVLDSGLNGGLTAFWALSEDQNLVNFMERAGLADENGWAKYLDSRESNTAFENRVHTALADMGFGFMAQGVVGVIRSIKNSRFVVRDAVEASEAAVAAGKASPLELTEIALKAETTAAKVKQDEIIELLGDPSGKLVLFKRSAPRPKLGSAAPELESLDEFTLVEAARSIEGRAATAADITEPLTVEYNWARIEAPEDIKRILSDTGEGFAEEISTARGPVRRLKVVAAEADEIDAYAGVEARRLINDPVPLRDSELVALRNLHIESARKTKELARIYNGSPSPGRLTAFSKMLSIHREIQRQYGASRAQASRTLGSQRIPARDKNSYTLINEMDQLMAATGDDLGAKGMAKAIALLDDAGRSDSVDKLLTGFPRLIELVQQGAPVMGALRTLYYFALLSRAVTQIRNTVSSFAHFGIKTAELKAASMLAKLTREEGEGVLPGEASEFLNGGIRGIFTDALSIRSMGKFWFDTATGNVDDFAARLSAETDVGAFKAFKTGVSGHGVLGKVDAPAIGGFHPDNFNFDPEGNVARVFRALDLGFSVPQRALVTVDEVFKNAFYRAEGQRIAYAQASHEMQSGIISNEQFMHRMVDLSSNPTPAMKLSMTKMAKEGTFTQTPTGAVWEWFKATRKLPVIGRMSLPFSQSPYNIAWEGMRRSPFAPGMKNFQTDMLSKDPRVVDLAWTRFLLGNATMLAIHDLFTDNQGLRVIGDNLEWDETEQANRMNLNNMEIHIAMTSRGFDGEYLKIPFRGTEPLAFPLGVVANLIHLQSLDEWDDEDQDITDLVFGVGAGMAMQFTSANMISGMADFMDAARNPDDPKRGLAEFFRSGAATLLTPGASAQFVQMMDPIYRETFTQLDKIKSQTPGMSPSLPVAYDAWGHAKSRVGGWEGMLGSLAPNVVDSSRAPQAIDVWLDRNDEIVRKPEKTNAEFRDGVEIKWKNHPDAYSRYVWLQGTGLKDPMRDPNVQRLAALPGSGVKPPSGWFPVGIGLVDELNLLAEGTHPIMQQQFNLLSRGKDGGQINFIRQAISYYRKAAREVLLHDPDYADLNAEVRQGVRKRVATDPNMTREKASVLDFGL